MTDDDLAAFSTCLDLLGEKAPVVLVQLPPRFPADPDLLDGFLRRWPDGRRLAFEFRDPAWHTDAVFRVLRTHNAAFVPFELGDERAPAVATADFVYVRLHGREAKYRGRYDEAALGAWADWLRGHVARRWAEGGARRLDLFRQHQARRRRRGERADNAPDALARSRLKSSRCARPRADNSAGC